MRPQNMIHKKLFIISKKKSIIISRLFSCKVLYTFQTYFSLNGRSLYLALITEFKFKYNLFAIEITTPFGEIILSYRLYPNSGKSWLKKIWPQNKVLEKLFLILESKIWYLFSDCFLLKFFINFRLIFL